MNKIILVVLLMLCFNINAAPPNGYCDVLICNKLERFTLSIWELAMDKLGEECYQSIVHIDDAIQDKIIDSSTRWYQGNSINITKRSVTRIKEVLECTDNKTLDGNLL